MSNYHIKEYDQNQYSFRLYDNTKKLTPERIKAETGCFDLINLAYFNLTTYVHESAIMIGGIWKFNPKYHEYGICIDKDGKMTLGTEKEAIYDYAVALPPVDINGKSYTNKYVEPNGVTYTGMKANGSVVAMVSTKDNLMDSTQAVAVMRQAGCVHIFRWDGSWSSQGYIDGQAIKASQYRTVRSLLLIFKKNEVKKDGGTPVTNKKYTVCLDPGHHGKSTNCSPDKAYWEYKFAWDISVREKKLLEYNGINVVLTKDSEIADKSLTDRAGVSNAANADLLVSNHTNAASGTGWSAPRGLEIITSAAGATAGRNIAANKLIARFKEVGIVLRPSTLIHNNSLTVLTSAKAPAVLIEYGFHTNKEDVALLLTDAYKDKLAEATVKGICDYFGIVYKAPQSPTTPTTPPSNTVGSGVSKWATEAWQKAVSKGVMEDSNPQGIVTREMLAVALNNLGLL